MRKSFFGLSMFVNQINGSPSLNKSLSASSTISKLAAVMDSLNPLIGNLKFELEVYLACAFSSGTKLVKLGLSISLDVADVQHNRKWSPYSPYWFWHSLGKDQEHTCHDAWSPLMFCFLGINVSSNILRSVRNLMTSWEILTQLGFGCIGFSMLEGHITYDFSCYIGTGCGF